MTPAEFPLSVLIAEDDEDDQYLLKRAFKEGHLNASPFFVGDGMDLMERLSSGTHIPLPDLILLDLNMPRLDGRQALKAVKADPRLKMIPVIVLTTSKDTGDIDSSYANGANSFFSKPSNFSELVSLVSLLRDYWVKGVELPLRA